LRFLRNLTKLHQDRHVQDNTPWTKCSLGCQKSKVNRHIQSPFQKIEIPDARFNFIILDLVGPLQSSKGITYCLTIIDRYTCWTEFSSVTRFVSTFNVHGPGSQADSDRLIAPFALCAHFIVNVGA